MSVRIVFTHVSNKIFSFYILKNKYEEEKCQYLASHCKLKFIIGTKKEEMKTKKNV